MCFTPSTLPSAPFSALNLCDIFVLLSGYAVNDETHRRAPDFDYFLHDHTCAERALNFLLSRDGS